MPREVIGDSIAVKFSMLAVMCASDTQASINDVVSEMGDQKVDTAMLQESFDNILAKYKITRNEDGSFNLDGSRIADAEANNV